MCDSKEMVHWDHTAAICATIINMHRDPKKGTAADPLKMNPYRSKSAVKPVIKLNSQDSMKLLKRVFIDHQMVNKNALLQGKIE